MKRKINWILRLMFSPLIFPFGFSYGMYQGIKSGDGIWPSFKVAVLMGLLLMISLRFVRE